MTMHDISSGLPYPNTPGTYTEPLHIVYTVYPKNYTYVLRFDLFCCSYVVFEFTHILHTTEA